MNKMNQFFFHLHMTTINFIMQSIKMYNLGSGAVYQLPG